MNQFSCMALVGFCLTPQNISKTELTSPMMLTLTPAFLIDWQSLPKEVSRWPVLELGETSEDLVPVKWLRKELRKERQGALSSWGVSVKRGVQVNWRRH